jgi:DNA (cytosine-5)-methyltransferase 1
MKFLDLFAGIGGFRMGMELAGNECVGYVEIDKFARKSYEAIYDTEGEWTAHDITSVTNDDLRFLATRGIDVICGGFPCQAFSVAGKRLGFEDTRGTLFFEIARFAKEIQPRYLFLENVKGLLSHDKGRTFETILYTLDELGYDAEWQVLNSKDFGVPQNRERVFIIGHFRGKRTRKVFPITREDGEVTTELKPLIGGKQAMRVFDPNGLSVTLSAQGGGWGAKTGLYAIPVLTPDREEKRQNGRRFKEPNEPMFTLTAQDRHGVLVSQKTGVRETEISNCLDASYYKGLGNNQERIGVQENYRIRRLTPRECWRLQGFPEWAFDRAAKVNSDSQLYKQAGNSVTVNVIYEIAKRLKEE